MSRPENLYHLQQIDSRLDGLKARLQEIKRILADDRVVKVAEAEAQAAEDNFTEYQKALRIAKQAVQDQRAKIKQSENLLYSGKVSNPKELEDIQNEIAALKRYLDLVEERQLEAMLALDEAQAGHEAAQSRLAQARAESADRNARLVDEKSEIEVTVNELELQRDQQAANIDPQDMPIYDRLRKKRAGVAVAKVQDRNCTACGTTLASALFQQARSPSKIVFCETCKRILYAE